MPSGGTSTGKPQAKPSTSSIWTTDEDEKLRALVARFGVKQWVVVASHLKNKNSKQARRRWKNCLNADNKQGGWSAEEDRVLLEGHKQFGNKWTEIAKLVGGRTDNAVKNRWAALRKRGERPTMPAKRGHKKTSQKIPCVTRTVTPPSAADSDEEDADHITSSTDSEAEEVERAPTRARGGVHRHTPSRSVPATARASPEGDDSDEDDTHLEAQHPQHAQQQVQVQQQAQQQAQQQRQRQRQQVQEQEQQQPSKRSRLSNGTCLDMSVLAPQGSGGSHTSAGSGPSRRHSHPKVAADERTTSSISPPSRYQDLTLLIPNSNADPPTAAPQPSVPAYYQGMEFRVFKDTLSPADKRFAQEINSMDIPLHINIEDAPLTTSRRAQQEAINALMEGSPTTVNGGPLTLSGYGPGGLHTSTSANAPLPSAQLVSSTSSQPEQFNELLRYLHSGVTPHSSKPAPLPNGVSRTPRSAGTARVGQSPATTKSRAGQQAQQQQQQQSQQQLSQCQPPVAAQQMGGGSLSPRRAGMRSSSAAPVANAQPALGEGHLHLLGRLFNSAHQTAELVSPCPGSPSFMPPSLLASPVHQGAPMTSGPLAPNMQARHQQAFLLQQQQQQQQQQQFQFQFPPTQLHQPYCQPPYCQPPFCQPYCHLQPFAPLPAAIPSPLYVHHPAAAFGGLGCSSGLEVVGMHIPPQVLQQQEQQQQVQQAQLQQAQLQQAQQQQHRHPGPLGQLQLCAGIPSEAAWQGIDVLTTPSLSGPELSLLLDALNSSR